MLKLKHYNGKTFDAALVVLKCLNKDGAFETCAPGDIIKLNDSRYRIVTNEPGNVTLESAIRTPGTVVKIQYVRPVDILSGVTVGMKGIVMENLNGYSLTVRIPEISDEAVYTLYEDQVIEV